MCCLIFMDLHMLNICTFCISRMTSLDVMYVPLDVLLNKNCQHFKTFFSGMFILDIGLQLVCLVLLSSLGIRIVLAVWNEPGNVPSLPILWNSVELLLVLLQSLVKFSSQFLQSWAFLCGDTFVIASISLLVPNLFNLLMSSSFNSGGGVIGVQEFIHFPLDFPVFLL